MTHPAMSGMSVRVARRVSGIAHVMAHLAMAGMGVRITWRLGCMFSWVVSMLSRFRLARDICAGLGTVHFPGFFMIGMAMSRTILWVASASTVRSHRRSLPVFRPESHCSEQRSTPGINEMEMERHMRRSFC